jgi:hypothetical protein
MSKRRQDLRTHPVITRVIELVAQSGLPRPMAEALVCDGPGRMRQIIKSLGQNPSTEELREMADTIWDARVK